MDIEQAEQIAKDPVSYSGEVRKQMFVWADEYRFNKKNKLELRQRAETVFNKLYSWALSEVDRSDKNSKYRAY